MNFTENFHSKIKAAYNHGYLPDTARRSEYEIHHARQENISPKLVANISDTNWSFIPLVLIVSELLLKSNKSK